MKLVSVLISTCTVDGDVNWSMKDIWDQNDADRADIQIDEEGARYRAILDKFESKVYDAQAEETISQFLYEVLDLMKPYFHPDLVEVQEIKHTDTYGPIRFTQIGDNIHNMVFDFPPKAHVSEIDSSSVDAILDQTDTHYIQHMTNNSVKLMNQSVFE
jgi:hypothetical protein